MGAFNNNQGAPPSDFNDYVSQLVQQNVQQQLGSPPNQGAQPPAPQQPAQGINVSAFGQQYNFSNEQELGQALEATIRGYQEKVDELQNGSGGGTPTAPAGQSAPDDFDSQKYADLMGTDPRAAQNYLDSWRFFDGQVDNPTEVIKESLVKQHETEQKLAVYQFKELHPEFMASPQGANIVQGFMQQGGWDFTVQNLEAALAIAQSRGMLPTRSQYDQAIQQTQQQVQTGFQQQVLPQLPPPQQPPAQQMPGDPDLAAIQQAMNAQNQLQQPPAQGVPQGQYQPQPPQPQPNMNFQVQGGGNPPHMNPYNPGLPPVAPAPPTLSPTGGGQFPGSWETQAENLTPEQIEQVFKQYGNL